MLTALKPFGSADWERSALSNIVRVRHVVCRTEAELAAHAADVDILLSDVEAPVSTAVLSSAARLRAVVCMSTGVDFVDLQGATERNVIVTNLPDYAVEAVAEHAIALLFALLRHIVRGDRLVRESRWSERSGLGASECANKVLGIIGAGRIGRRVAEIGKALGMRVVAFSPRAPTSQVSDGLELCDSLADLLQVADFVSIHTSLRPATRGMFGAAEFRLMKHEALLINTSRGAVVDEHALIAALRAGMLAGAALDVFDVEPPATENPLLGMDNVVLSPHVAWFTREARQRARQTIHAQVAAISRGELPVHVVNPDAAGGWLRRWPKGTVRGQTGPAGTPLSP
jgi:D-3-phosphoglycerate dehydrogenase